LVILYLLRSRFDGVSQTQALDSTQDGGSHDIASQRFHARGILVACLKVTWAAAEICHDLLAPIIELNFNG
jgi:hypothetical protein